MEEKKYLDENAMDTSVRPQDDLFRYVNGTWLKTHEIPSDRGSDGSFRTLLENSLTQCRALCEEAENEVLTFPDEVDQNTAKLYSRWISGIYQAYMDTDALNIAGVTPIKPLWESVDGAVDHAQLSAVLGELERQGVSGLYGFYIGADANDPTRYTAYFSQGGLGLPDESYYREEQHEELRVEYRKYLAKMLKTAGLAATDEAAEQDAEKIFELEKQLAKHHWDTVRSRDAVATNNPTTWEKLVADNPGFDFAGWARGYGMGEQASDAYRNADGELVQISDINTHIPDFVPAASQIWAETEIETLKLWLKFKVLSSFASSLTDELQQIKFDFYSTTLSGVPERSEKWKRAVGVVEGALGEVIGQAYVTRHFPPAHREKMEALTGRLIEAYRVAISKLDWMGEETRQRALVKLSKFTPKIGYPAVWRDYSGLGDFPEGGLVAALARVNAFETAYRFGQLYGPIDENEWHMTPQTVNAYYHPVVNEIVFPAAILQRPFFDPEAPDCVNFGAIGAIIGHEIGHGFDDQGSQYDGDGKLNNWWTDQDRDEFESRTKALIAQYDAYTPAQLDGEDVHVNGAFTIGENIGDLGGLSISYQALCAGGELNDEEKRAFFYSWASCWQAKVRDELARQYLVIDPHSPAEFRCNGVVRNMDVFHEVFATTPNDGLWLDPDQRVRIWE